MRVPTHIPTFLRVALFAALSAVRLAAQAPAESWSIRVAALDIAGAHDTLWLRTGPGKEPVQVSLNTRVFSQPVDYKGPARLAFYQNATEAKAEEPPAPLASTVLKHKSSLLVFSPQQEGKSYETFVLADLDFPFGSFRLVNFSSATMRAELSGKPVLLKPGAAETVVDREAANSIPVRILALVKDSPPRLIRQTSWSIVPTQRELVMFFPNPDSGLVRLRHFVDSKVEIGAE